MKSLKQLSMGNALKRISTLFNTYARKIDDELRSARRMVVLRARSIPTQLRNKSNILFLKVEGSMSKTYYGRVRLMNRETSLVGYIILIELLALLMLKLDDGGRLQQFIHPVNGNDLVVGVVTILFALLVPLSIALIEDADKDPLQRQVIIKSILRAGFTPVLLMAIFAHLIVPQHWQLAHNQITLKTVTAVPMVIAFIFIMFSFYRSYKWLVDGSQGASGVSSGTDPNNPESDSPVSYKFAQIIKTLANDNTSERWNMVWQKKFPYWYEHALHVAYFARLHKLIEKPTDSRMSLVAAETSAYMRGFSNRDISMFQYVDIYLESFLKLHALLLDYWPLDRDVYSQFRTAQMNTERVIKPLLKKGLNRDELWSILNAMNIYVNNVWYFKSAPKRTVTIQDRIVPFFITELLDALVSGRIGIYDIDAPNNEANTFTITYGRLNKPRAILQISLLRAFDRWITEKLNNIEENTKSYALADAIEYIFPEADPATMSELLWFKHVNGSNADASLAFQNFIENERVFGYGSRVYGQNYVNADQNLKNFNEFINGQVTEAVKLFALISRGYFTNVINLDSLIEATSVGYDVVDENLDARIKRFRAHLILLKKYI